MIDRRASLRKATLLTLLVTLMFISPGMAEVQPSKVSKQTWHYVETENFTLVTDVSKRNTIRLAQKLEKFRSLVALFFNNNTPISARPVKVYITDSQRNYELLTSYNEALENTGGFFRDTLNGNYAVMRYHNKGSVATLFHEYTHYLTANLTDQNFPFWYNEGLAEFLGELEFRKSNVVLYGKLNRYHLANLNYWKWIGVETLFRTRTLDRSNQTHTNLIYSLSWLVVHYFRNDPELAKQLRHYIRLTQQGVDEAKAVEQAMGIDFVELDRRIKAYSKQRRHEFSKITLKDPLSEGDINVVKLNRTEVAYHIGEFFLQAGFDAERAEVYFDEALTHNSNHVGALTGKANTAMFRCNIDKCQSAIAWINKAKRLDPDNPFTATVSGHINANLLNRIESDSERVMLWNAAVQNYNSAINSGELNLEAISAAANMYTLEGRWKKAHELHEIVYINAPSNHTARLNMIFANIAVGKLHQAEAIADKVRNNNHFSDQIIQDFNAWFNEVQQVRESGAE